MRHPASRHKISNLTFSSYQHFAGGGSELLRNGLVGVGLLERFQGPHGEYVVVQLVGEANHSLPLLLVKGPLVKQDFLDGRSEERKKMDSLGKFLRK